MIEDLVLAALRAAPFIVCQLVIVLHHNGRRRASFHAHSAEDAAQYVHIIGRRISFARAIWSRRVVLRGNDSDNLRRACGCTERTADALFKSPMRPGLITLQAVQPAEALFHLQLL